LRRDANEQLKSEQKDGTLSEDELKRHQEEVQKLTDRYVKEIDGVLANKEQEIMQV
jgi:ribosome recycling factor